MDEAGRKGRRHMSHSSSPPGRDFLSTLRVMPLPTQYEIHSQNRLQSHNQLSGQASEHDRHQCSPATSQPNATRTKKAKRSTMYIRSRSRIAEDPLDVEPIASPNVEPFDEHKRDSSYDKPLYDLLAKIWKTLQGPEAVSENKQKKMREQQVEEKSKRQSIKHKEQDDDELRGRLCAHARRGSQGTQERHSAASVWLMSTQPTCSSEEQQSEEQQVSALQTDLRACLTHAKKKRFKNAGSAKGDETDAYFNDVGALIIRDCLIQTRL